MAFDIGAVRAQFPSLGVRDDGKPRIYLDNPAGTQVPQRVVDRISEYFLRANSNRGGSFATACISDALIETARRGMADFVNARSPEEIVFGPNMTSLTFQMTRALAPLIRPGDEILVTRMDHDANVTPWRLLAERAGATLKWLDFSRDTFRYELDDLDRLLSSRTRLAAVNYASNVTGTINDVGEIARRVRAAGGLTYVDAVQFAPHGVVDVLTLGCDFLVCSAYKFYGPHAGILWGRRDLLENLKPEKLEASSNELPSRYEIGTQSHEAIAGILGALEYYAWLGADLADTSFRARVNAGKAAMQCHEEKLATRLIDGLSTLQGVRIHGLTGANETADRVSTISLSVDGHSPDALAAALGDRNIFVWSGHNYALGVIDRLGVSREEGVLRIGPVHYNTAEEIDIVLSALERLIGPRSASV
jgi:cysteine desulfurase family protein (TIGR01976 family)